MDTEIVEEPKEKNLKNSEEALITEVDELTEEIKKQNSRPRMLFDGILRGFGYAIGATILFGLLITILGVIVNRSDAAWVDMLVEWLGLTEYLN